MLVCDTKTYDVVTTTIHILLTWLAPSIVNILTWSVDPAIGGEQCRAGGAGHQAPPSVG